MSDNVIPFKPNDSLTLLLQDSLCDVLQQERFKGITICQVVGVLEFLKWNLINRSD